MFKSKIITSILTVILFFSSLASLNADADYKSQIYNAYVSSKMDTWEKTMQLMESEFVKTKKASLLFDLTLSQYGVIGYNIIKGNHEKALYYLEKADRNIEKLINFNSKWSEAYALKGALIGFHIGLEKYKAIYLGPRSIENINYAIELNKNNPTGWLEKANAEFHMPSFFGGSKERAISYYKKAVQLFEVTGKTKNSWLYLNAMILLALAYEDIERFDYAKIVYEKILHVEPNLVWVKTDLYPKCAKKVK